VVVFFDCVDFLIEAIDESAVLCNLFEHGVILHLDLSLLLLDFLDANVEFLILLFDAFVDLDVLFQIADVEFF
jgi:hypothetical protein